MGFIRVRSSICIYDMRPLQKRSTGLRPARSADFQSAGVSNYRTRAHLDPWQTGSLRNSRLGSLRYDRQPALPGLREPFAEVSIRFTRLLPEPRQSQIVNEAASPVPRRRMKRLQRADGRGAAGFD